MVSATVEAPRARDLWERLARMLFFAAGAGALVTLLTAIVYAIVTLTSRKYGQVEAEMVFEALRTRQGFPIYFDPVVGANEYGDPPTRYFVLYTAVWPWILSNLGPPTLLGLRSAGRIFNGILWLGCFAFIASMAPKKNLKATLVAAALGCGGYFMARETTLACADTLACVLAALGLLRAVKKGEMDLLSAALLATAPFVKPSVVGITLGVCLAHVIAKRFAAWRGILAFAIIGLAWLVICRRASDGFFPLHLLRATGQTLSFDRLISEFFARGLFLGLPHAVVLILSFRAKGPLGIPRESGGGLVYARTALATSLAISIFFMSKHGSGGHYFIETTLAAVICVAETEWSFTPRARALTWLGGAVLATTVCVQSFYGLREDLGVSENRREVIAALRQECPLGPGDVVVSSDVVIELEMNGRIIIPVWQMSYLLRNGGFPADVWRKDLASPHIKCVIHTSELNDPVPAEIKGIIEVGAFRKELRGALDQNFVFDRSVMGWVVFKRR